MLGLSLLPCCRYHPAGMNQTYHPVFVCSSCLRPTDAGSASGASTFRGHLCVHSRYGLVTRSHPFDGFVNRLQDFGFPPPCYPSYRVLAFTLAGLTPAEHTSLCWTHFRTFGFPEYGLPIIFIRMPSHVVVPKGLWLEPRTDLTNRNSTCPDMPYTQDCGSGASDAGKSAFCSPGNISKMTWFSYSCRIESSLPILWRLH